MNIPLRNRGTTGRPGAGSLAPGFFLLSLALVAGIVIFHGALCFQAIQSYNALGNDSPYGAFGRRIPAPLNRSAFIDGDSYLWNQYAATIARGEDFRVRRNGRDNAPFGREVHWSSGYSYVLAGSGWIWKLLSGGDIEGSIEKASILINPLIFIVFLVTVGAITARKFGYTAAALLILAAGGTHQIYWAFFPGKPDHHSLITVSAFGTMACIVAGGSGWVCENKGGRGEACQSPLLPDRRDAGRWFVASAVFGGVGFWTSALTQSLVTAMVCVGAAAASLFIGRTGTAGVTAYRPELWSLWGRVGAATAVFFYLLEYAPGHLGMRIEVNHPLYALAWWGSGELLAVIFKWRTGTLRGLAGKDWLLGALSVGGLSVMPLLLWYGGDRYYSPIDPFFMRVSPHILEQTPLEAMAFMRDLGMLTAAASLSVLLLLHRRPGRESRFPLAMLTLWTLMSLGLTLWYMRWAFLLAVTLVLLLVYCIVEHCRGERVTAKGRFPVVLAATLMFTQLCVFGTYELKRGFRFRRADSNEFNMVNFAWQRHLAEAIRADSRGEEVILLSDPGTSVVMSYFGGLKGVASLYWENIEGLKAAADIYTAKTDAEAFRLVRQRRITHIVLFRSYEPSRRFFEIKYGHYDPNEAYRTFGSKMYIRLLPDWLRRIPLHPTAREFSRMDVDVFKVVGP